MAEREEELKSLLRKVKEECEKADFKLNFQKTKIMASGPITSWQIDGKTMETMRDFIFLGSKITADGDCSHEIKRCLLLGRKAMTNLDNILKSRDISLPKKVHLVKAMFFLFFVFVFFFYFTILYWFCHTSTWICHGCTCAPHTEPPSHLPTHTIPLGHPSAPAPSILYPALNLDWHFVSYMILYMFQCHSPKSSPPPSPTESKRLFYISVSLSLSHIQGYCYHLSKFNIYVLVYCIGVFLSGLLHSV